MVLKVPLAKLAANNPAIHIALLPKYASKDLENPGGHMKNL